MGNSQSNYNLCPKAHKREFGQVTSKALILVTGATGYIGGRLIAKLVSSGYRVRAFGRSLEKMACRPWASSKNVELFQGDVLEEQDLAKAAQGCNAAYYLVHSMIAKRKAYAEADRRAADHMRKAAENSGIEQIIYLGGLGDVGRDDISHHLQSRHEVGRILQSGAIPTTVLRAAMIIGSGSASFEILRYLVDRLPVMITPRWVHTPTQPIAINDVLSYLIECLGNRSTFGRTFDIGGPEVVNYADLIRIYAQEAGLPRRWVVPVPVLTPRLSAHWIHLVTPVPDDIALPLTEGLSVPTTCTDTAIREIIDLDLTDCRMAIRIALNRILEKQVETCWSDAGDIQTPAWAACGDAHYAGGTILNCAYRITMKVPPKSVWQTVVSMGGEKGYYFGNGLWRLRGRLDRWIGGVGLRRGRRHPEQLQTGDALDFWRVMTIEPNHRLTLVAEMKMPGEALLDLQIEALGNNRSELRMISRFLPRGLMGLLYWYLLYPFHVWLFRGMLTAMARRAGSIKTALPVRFDPNIRTNCTLKRVN